MSAPQLNSPPINISIQPDERFPASPWKEYDTDWKFPTEPDMDNPNSNTYTPSYGSFNSIGSRSPSWGGREAEDPMNLYENDDMFEMSAHPNRRHQTEYDPSQYDGNIVGDMDGIEDIPLQAAGGLNLPPSSAPINHYSPTSNDGSPSSSRSRASSTSSMYHSIPSPPKTIYPSSLTNHNPPLSGTKTQSPPALVIPDDVQQQGHLQRGGLQQQNPMSINIVPSTPIGGLGDPKHHVFPQPSNPSAAQEPWQSHSRHSSSEIPFSFTQHRSPALSATSSLHNSPLPPSSSLPNIGMMGGMESTTPLLPPHSLHNSPLLHSIPIPPSSSSPLPSASPAALSLHNSPLLQGSYNNSHGSSSARNSPIPSFRGAPTHTRATSDDFLLPESAAHQRPRAASWGEHNAPSIGVTSTSSGGSLGLNFLSGPPPRNMYPSSMDLPSSGFGESSSTINDLLQPPSGTGGLGLGLGLPSGAKVRRAHSEAGGAHRKIKSEDLRDYFNNGGGGGSSGSGGAYRVTSDTLSVPTPSLGLANVSISPNDSISPAPGRSPHLGHRASSSLSNPIGHTVGSSHRSSHSIGSSAGFHSQRSSPYPSPHASPSLRGSTLSNDLDGFGGGGYGSGMNYSNGLLSVPGPPYGGGALAPPSMQAQSGMGIGLANLSISGSPGMNNNMMGGGPNNQMSDTVMNPPKKLVTTKATHDASTARRKNDAAFVCPVPGCGSTFTRSFNLKGHLRSHNEERPFKCKWPGCEKGFARQHDCKRHEALHLNIRPYTCTGCKKTFARMDALNRHRGAECLGHDPGANSLSPNAATVSPSPMHGMSPYAEDKELKYDPDYGPRSGGRGANGMHQNGGGGGGRNDDGMMVRGRQLHNAGQAQGQEMDGLIM